MKRHLVTLLVFLSATLTSYANNPVLDKLVYDIRNPQTGPEQFRKTLERIGEYVAIDVARELETEEMRVETLTGAEAVHHLVKEEPILVTILRAGLPLNDGVRKVFPDSEVGFFVMARNEETLKADINYISLPEVRGRTVIVTDTMLATGGSMLDAIVILEKLGPKNIIVVSAIAAEPGIQRILAHNPNIKIFAAAVDPTLNERGYIIPGLGDAGDRCYGDKVHTKIN